MPPYAPLQRLRKLIKMSHEDRNEELTPAQRYMYGSEVQTNFRGIAKLCATRSSYTLTANDLASADLHKELAEIGQFAEIAYPSLSPELLFEHLEVFMRVGFPLAGYDALQDAILVSGFEGKVARQPGLVCYRPQLRQLVVAFSGSSNNVQAFYDVRFSKRRHPAGPG